MTQVINVANFKGGVGKTTTTVMLSLLLSQKNNKVLLVDFDPQGNATDLLYYKTFEKAAPQKTIYQAIQDKDLTPAIHALTDNLHIIPAEGDLRNFPRLLARMFGRDYIKYGFLLDALLMPLKDDYDYIFIDVPPTISDFTDNAIVASDHIAIVMQTQEFSLGAAEDFIPYVNEVLEKFETDVNLLAAIPVLMKKGGRVDELILEEAKKMFKEKLTSSPIKIRERIKAWGVTGIRDEDMHDKEALDMYRGLAEEMSQRMEKFAMEEI